MNNPIVVWVVDDAVDDSHRASLAVLEVGRFYREQRGVELSLLCAPDFEWPPFARLSFPPGWPEAKKAIKEERLETPPDIVILDLVNQKKEGEPLDGKRFYQNLRKWEIPQGRSAFVVIWSFYAGGMEAEAFVNKACETDRRLKALATKQPSILQTCVSGLYERVIEERERL
jgi:hypothetical protein